MIHLIYFNAKYVAPMRKSLLVSGCVLLISLLFVGCAAAESLYNQGPWNESPTISPAVLQNTAALVEPTPTAFQTQEGVIKNGASGSSTVKLGSGTYSVTASNSGTHYDVNKQTALGALIASGKSYTITDAHYAEYGSLFVDSIGGKAGVGSKGWMYQVNSGTPSVGANTYSVGDGDEVVWYWSEGMSSTPATSSQTIRLTVSTASSTPTQVTTTAPIQTTHTPTTVTTSPTAKAPTTVPRTTASTATTTGTAAATLVSTNPTTVSTVTTTQVLSGSSAGTTGQVATPASSGISAGTTCQTATLVALNSSTGTTAQDTTLVASDGSSGTTGSLTSQISSDSSSGTASDLTTQTTLVTLQTQNTTANTTIPTTASTPLVTSNLTTSTNLSTPSVTTVGSTGVMTPAQTATHKSPGPSGLAVVMVVLGAFFVGGYRKRE